MSRLEAFTVRKYLTSDGEEKSSWTRIGVAFPHKSGGGFNISLECVPVPTIKDGKASVEIVLRPPMEKTDRPAKGGSYPTRSSEPPPDEAAPW
jgi:hypothetical protein